MDKLNTYKNVTQLGEGGGKYLYYAKIKCKYSRDLNTRLVWFSNGLKLSKRQMVQTKLSLVVKPPFEYRKFEYWTCKSPVFG